MHLIRDSWDNPLSPRRRVNAVSLDALAEKVGMEKCEALVDRGSDPVPHAERKLVAQQVRRAVLSLPAVQRYIVARHFWAGETIKQIDSKRGRQTSWELKLIALRSLRSLLSAMED